MRVRNAEYKTQYRDWFDDQSVIAWSNDNHATRAMFAENMVYRRCDLVAYENIAESNILFKAMFYPLKVLKLSSWRILR